MSYHEASGHLCRAGMRLTVSTWNINSVRLRINLVAKFIKAAQPDVLCLKETKCPDDYFLRKRLARLGYPHIALSGQKGYRGWIDVMRAFVPEPEKMVELSRPRLGSLGSRAPSGPHLGKRRDG